LGLGFMAQGLGSQVQSSGLGCTEQLFAQWESASWQIGLLPRGISSSTTQQRLVTFSLGLLGQIPVLSYRFFRSNGSRKSTAPQNRQFIVNYD
jgi:hypothetical protein